MPGPGTKQAQRHWKHKLHKKSQQMSQYRPLEGTLWISFWMPVLWVAWGNTASHVPVYKPGHEANNESYLKTTQQILSPAQHTSSSLHPFLKMCKAMCELEELEWHDRISLVIRKPAESQQTLGKEFLIWGYLTIDWLVAIQANHPDKSGLLLTLTQLYVGLWKTLFTSIWE